MIFSINFIEVSSIFLIFKRSIDSDYIVPSYIKDETLLSKKLTKGYVRKNITLKEKTIIPQFCYKQKDCDFHSLRWMIKFPECGENLQSPIDIDVYEAKPMFEKEIFPHFVNVVRKLPRLSVGVRAKNVHVSNFK